MKRLRNYWEMLSHIGTDSDMSYIQQKRVNMVNLIALLCVLPTIYFSIVNLFEQRYFLSAINFSNGICSLSVLLLQYFGRRNFAKVMLLASNFLFFFAGAILYRNGGEYFLLCILIVSMLLYDNRRIHIAFGLAVTLAIGFIYLFPDLNYLEQPVPTSRVVFNIVCSLAFMVVTVNFFIQIIYNNMKKIEDQSKKLQLINREKEKVFSIIAHDIKSPFATFETMVLALKEQVINNTVSQDFIQQLHQKIVHQNQTLDDLLQWGSSSMQGITTVPSSITIKPLIQDIIRIFEQQIQLKQLKVHINIHEETKIIANRDHTIIILRNLISNAIKFSYIAGEINIYTTIDKDHTLIHIQDQGIGINPSKSALLFNVIQHKSLGTVDEPGTGLGLVLCKDLIERNNGIVHIQSTLNKGSIFTVGLPSDGSPEINSAIETQPKEKSRSTRPQKTYELN